MSWPGLVIPWAIHKFGKNSRSPASSCMVHFWNAAKNPLTGLTDLATKDQAVWYDAPFIHADEVEQSYALALFPELCRRKTPSPPNLPHAAAGAYQQFRGKRRWWPIKWYNAYGSVGMECICSPEGVIGDPTKANADKAKAGIEHILDYMEKLVKDILTAYPAGKLPPIEKVTQRRREDIEAVIKGPSNGGSHIYTLTY